ncbi:MAG: methyltransferase domain-containing protein [Magnetococcus sp. YQC-5]
MKSWLPWRKILVPSHFQLHLGCGNFAPEGWLNCDGSWHAWLSRHPRFRKMLLLVGWLPKEHDPWPETILRLDLRKPLPFASNTFVAVYSSHMLEHLYRNEALALLREIHRCCRKGAIVRFVIPNLAKDLADYQQGLISPTSPAPTPADSLMAALHLRPSCSPTERFGMRTLYHLLLDFNSHKWLYDQTSLMRLFQEAGFAHPTPMDILASRIPEIDRIERPERLGGTASLIMEAVRE